MSQPEKGLPGSVKTIPSKEIPKAVSRLRLINITRGTELARSVEVAGSGAKRTKGLLGRKSMADGEALWIVPCEAIHTFGMQFAIDLIYLDRNHRIKKIRTHVAPWRLSACLSAHSVIEFPAGAVRETDAAPGDVLEFQPDPPTQGTSERNAKGQ